MSTHPMMLWQPATVSPAQNAAVSSPRFFRRDSTGRVGKSVTGLE